MRALLAAAFVLAALARPAAAGDPLPDLVPPTTCLAGSWGQSSRIEWRVQLGVFDDHAAASRFASALRAKGLGADEYVAAWRVRDDKEPIAVVSHAQSSREAAARAVGRYRAAAPGAFTRRYRIWR
jgi:hypothetical protein